MHTRSGTIMAAGVIASIIGIVVVIAYGQSVQRHVAGGGTLTAYAATKDIPAGTRGEDAVKLMQQTSVPRALRPSAAITDPKQLVGRIAVRPVVMGEVMTSTQFGTSATSAAPAAGLQIPPGMDAVSMNFAPPQGASSWVQPGDLVNVFATFKPQSGPQTKLILSNVQVLADGDSTKGSPRGLGASSTSEIVLTMALRPGDAEKLVFAKENGSVWLAIVHPGDAPTSSGGSSLGSVLR